MARGSLDVWIIGASIAFDIVPALIQGYSAIRISSAAIPRHMRILENQAIFDDVITGQKWRRIKKSFDGLQDTGLDFYIKQSDLEFRPLEALWIFIIEVMFSILRLKKIDQNGPESDIQNLFYTNSSTQNPMSWSVFS